MLNEGGILWKELLRHAAHVRVCSLTMDLLGF